MGVMISRSSCCYCRCCFFDCGFSRFLMMLRRELYFFQWRIESVERDREQLEGEPNTKIVKGIVTSCGHDYVWIEECIFFSTDDFIDPMPLQAGDKVVAFVEEDPLSHELKATEVCVVLEDDGPREPDCKIQYLSACVSHVKKDIIYIADEYYFYLDSISKGFSPYGGDWLDIEYSVQHDSSKITIHSLRATKCRQLEEVCVTSIHKGQGMLNYSIFFTFRSLNLPTGYTPHLGHMVSVVIIQSIRPKYNWRAISMTPVKKV